jgi:hypothetical protein
MPPSSWMRNRRVFCRFSINSIDSSPALSVKAQARQSSSDRVEELDGQWRPVLKVGHRRDRWGGDFPLPDKTHVPPGGAANRRCTVMPKNELEPNSSQSSAAIVLAADSSQPDPLFEQRKDSADSYADEPENQADSCPRAESIAQRRRRMRIALLEEFGGEIANIKIVAQEAIKRGMYSPRTRASDVELSFIRTWKLRNRKYNR